MGQSIIIKPYMVRTIALQIINLAWFPSCLWLNYCLWPSDTWWSPILDQGASWNPPKMITFIPAFPLLSSESTEHGFSWLNNYLILESSLKEIRIVLTRKPNYIHLQAGANLLIFMLNFEGNQNALPYSPPGENGCSGWWTAWHYIQLKPFPSSKPYPSQTLSQNLQKLPNLEQATLARFEPN